MTAAALCLVGLAVIVAIDFLLWAACAMAGQLDDEDELLRGIRRS